MLRRFYEDYFKQSRLDGYRNILLEARSLGYCMVGIRDFYNILKSGGKKDLRYLVNRHDIDTSPMVARKMFDIEKDVYGRCGSATYYFRKKTVDKNLIAEIDAYGYETGFHYETIADYAKDKNIYRKEEILLKLPEIRRIFIDDLKSFRAETGSESCTVSSHGDFVNNFLQIENKAILADSYTREQAEILLEAYDEIVNVPVQERFADQKLLSDFSRETINAIKREVDVVMILTHPRNQRVDLWWNTKDNINRLTEGIRYKIGM